MKSKKNLLILLVVVSFAFLFGFFLNKRSNESKLLSLSAAQRQEKIVQERDIAIKLAKEKGDYRCCINPPCTMCYMQANDWNNHTPGTCACDDLIQEGKEPCPECKRGLCSSDTTETSTCEVDLP